MAPSTPAFLVSHGNRQLGGGGFFIHLPKAFMDPIKDVVSKLISTLPLKKLHANQVFDLVADCLMLALVVPALFVNLGPSQNVLKPLMVFYSLAFITWSVKINR